jgi:hypothetical protein
VASALLLDLMYRSLVRQKASLTVDAGHPVVRTPRLDGFTAQEGNAVAVLDPGRSSPAVPGGSLREAYRPPGDSLPPLDALAGTPATTVFYRPGP